MLKTVRLAMLASIVIYGFIGYRAPQRVAPAPTLFYSLMIISVSCVGSVRFFRRRFVLRSEVALATQPDDPGALGRWRAGYIVIWALCEAIVLYGLLLRFLGFVQVLPFLIAGFVLMLFFSPRRPVESR